MKKPFDPEELRDRLILAGAPVLAVAELMAALQVFRDKLEVLVVKFLPVVLGWAKESVEMKLGWLMKLILKFGGWKKVEAVAKEWVDKINGRVG